MCPFVLLAVLVNQSAPTDLEGPWRAHQGDDRRYADPALDDSAWTLVKVPGPLADVGWKNYPGVAWLRRTVAVTPGRALAVSIGPISDAYAIYIDGVPVGGAGDVDGAVHGKLRSFAYPVPAGAGDDGKIVIALRVWAQPDNAAAYANNLEFMSGLWAVDDARALEDEVQLEFDHRMLTRFVPNLVCSVLCILVGLCSLALWLIRRQLREYLWFGAFGVLLGWSQVAWGLRDYGFLEGYWFEHRVARVALMAGIAAFLQFVVVFLGVRRTKPVRAMLIGFVALNALPVLWSSSWHWVIAIARPFLPAFGIGVLVLVTRAVAQKKPDAVPMLFGVALSATATVLIFLDGLGVAVLPFHRIHDFGAGTVLVLSTSMAIVMMVRFGRVYRELDQKNVDLLRLDQLKDEFMANTSHELRTPLSGIIGLAESLKDGATGALPEETKRNLVLIASSGRRLATLVNDILDFAKLKHSGIVLRSRAVDVHSVVDVVLTLLSPVAREKSVALLNEVSRDIPAAIADEDRLQQILHNLVGNALKFTERGAVTVSAAGNGDSERLAVIVHDTGIGIPADKIGRIFESFEQGDGSTERKYGGTGLGLAVTKKLVELHGGVVSVTSQPGVGSTFTFTLEKATALGEAAAAPAPSVALAAMAEIEHTPVPSKVAARTRTTEIAAVAMPVAGRHTVLVVDDEPVNLQVLDNQLRIEGFTVVKASDGEEALALLAKGLKADAVVLDVMMPKMSGYEVTRRIRAGQSPRLPIVLLTAKGREEDVVEGLATGASDYLTKPFKKGELVARLRTHLTLAKFDEAARRFVPFTFLELLGKQSLVDVTLGDGVQREMSVLFADIRSFTTIAEELGPQKIFNTINRYLSFMQPAVHAHKGFINQVYGDGIMALFVGDAKDAVAASIAMHEALSSFNAGQKVSGGPAFKIGIGVNTGPLMLGTLGDITRMECGVISDTVNTAARVEGMTKLYGASVLVGETTWSRLDDRSGLREVDRVIAKGKTEPTSIYEVIGADGPALFDKKRATSTVFSEALALYRAAQFGDAAARFDACGADDVAASIYAARCRSYLGGGAPAGFDGITRLEAK